MINCRVTFVLLPKNIIKTSSIAVCDSDDRVSLLSFLDLYVYRSRTSGHNYQTFLCDLYTNIVHSPFCIDEPDSGYFEQWRILENCIL